MAKYRKKPIVIEATRIYEQFEVRTNNGPVIASPGEWIITGIDGEQYPCQDHIFRATYEPVGPTDSVLASSGPTKGSTYESAEITARFRLNRSSDITGVSGTGIVADGEVYHDGTVRLYWRGKWKTSGEYPCLQAVEEIHCHHGATVIEWQQS